MKRLLWVIAIGFAAVTLMLASVFWRGPRMYRQASLRTWASAVPLPPSNSVPFDAVVTRAPSAAEAGALVNPVPDTDDARERGRVYYAYYCLACHGVTGDGEGPVGESYMPVPTDLRTAVPRIPTDGELLRRMLTGVGHEPVLERVVRPEHRWYLVRYLRHLGLPPSGVP